MMRRKRGSGRKIDAQLRAARPEPSTELTAAICQRMGAALRRSFVGGLARVRVAVAATLTALCLVPVLALGGATAAMDTLQGTVRTVHDDAPTDAQYGTDLCANIPGEQGEIPTGFIQDEAGNCVPADESAGDVVICVYGYAEHIVSQEVADELVALGVAEYGPCPPV